jgi:hypothetical protein
MNRIYHLLDTQGMPDRDEDVPYLDMAMSEIEEGRLTREQVLFELAGELAFLVTEFWPPQSLPGLHEDFCSILADAINETMETTFMKVQ